MGPPYPDIPYPCPGLGSHTVTTLTGNWTRTKLGLDACPVAANIPLTGDKGGLGELANHETGRVRGVRDLPLGVDRWSPAHLGAGVVTPWPRPRQDSLRDR